MKSGTVFISVPKLYVKAMFSKAIKNGTVLMTVPDLCKIYVNKLGL